MAKLSDFKKILESVIKANYHKSKYRVFVPTPGHTETIHLPAIKESDAYNGYKGWMQHKGCTDDTLIKWIEQFTDPYREAIHQLFQKKYIQAVLASSQAQSKTLDEYKAEVSAELSEGYKDERDELDEDHSKEIKSIERDIKDLEKKIAESKSKVNQLGSGVDPKKEQEKQKEWEEDKKEYEEDKKEEEEEYQKKSDELSAKWNKLLTEESVTRQAEAKYDAAQKSVKKKIGKCKPYEEAISSSLSAWWKNKDDKKESLSAVFQIEDCKSTAESIYDYFKTCCIDKYTGFLTNSEEYFQSIGVSAETSASTSASTSSQASAEAEQTKTVADDIWEFAYDHQRHDELVSFVNGELKNIVEYDLTKDFEDSKKKVSDDLSSWQAKKADAQVSGYDEEDIDKHIQQCSAILSTYDELSKRLSYKPEWTCECTKAREFKECCSELDNNLRDEQDIEVEYSVKHGNRFTYKQKEQANKDSDYFNYVWYVNDNMQDSIAYRSDVSIYKAAVGSAASRVFDYDRQVKNNDVKQAEGTEVKLTGKNIVNKASGSVELTESERVTAQDPFVKLINAIPSIKVVEYQPVMNVAELVNNVTAVFGIGQLMGENVYTSIMSGKSQEIEDKFKKFFDLCTKTSEGSLVDNIFKSFKDKGGSVPDRGRYSPGKDSKVQNDEGEFMGMFQFPYVMYRYAIRHTTLNTYEFPYFENNYMVGNGSHGWRDSTMAGFFGGSGGEDFLKFFNVNITTRPMWNADGNGEPYPAVNFELNLYNYNLQALVNNFLFVNTIVPNNMWLQRGILQQGSCLYDIQIPGRIRFFCCKADISVEHAGITRVPPNEFFDQIKLHVTKEYEIKDENYELIKVPDVYKLKISFQSLIPNNFNTYLFTYFNSERIEEQTALTISDNIKGEKTGISPNYLDAAQEGFEKTWEAAQKPDTSKPSDQAAQSDESSAKSSTSTASTQLQSGSEENPDEGIPEDQSYEGLEERDNGNSSNGGSETSSDGGAEEPGAAETNTGEEEPQEK